MKNGSFGLASSVVLVGSADSAGRSVVVVASSFKSAVEEFWDNWRRLLVELPT